MGWSVVDEWEVVGGDAAPGEFLEACYACHAGEDVHVNFDGFISGNGSFPGCYVDDAVEGGDCCAAGVVEG